MIILFNCLLLFDLIQPKSILLNSEVILLFVNSYLLKINIQLDSEIILIVDKKTDLDDLPTITNKLLSSAGWYIWERERERESFMKFSEGGGAISLINVDKLGEDDVLKLSGWASLVWVSVTKDNLEKTLKLMDSTITKKVSYDWFLLGVL